MEIRYPVSSTVPQVLSPCHGGPASPLLVELELEPPLLLVREEKEEGAEELRRGGVELKLEPPLLCLCRRHHWWYRRRRSRWVELGRRSWAQVGVTTAAALPSMGALQRCGMRKAGPHTVFAGDVCSSSTRRDTHKWDERERMDMLWSEWYAQPHREVFKRRQMGAEKSKIKIKLKMTYFVVKNILRSSK
jgi:hypothetical protein